ncbi:hypothetical protein OSB04_016366 [Centaurea solstitialis]|uniref:Uncharacterized protein n=1 Tax=Centaurea solstitialis TaxID=347529 RepID=A0AA38WKZ9_9ASTR|nr:hypothetical protein OSB04_016366 [Centaurea solstitialis]
MATPSTTSDNKTPFHPAFGITNIKNSIPIVLDQTDDHYASWVELFHIHACAYNVLDHIDPKISTPSDIDRPTWTRLDAIVKQWIYSTISTDLLQTIMKPATRAIYPEEQFTNTRLDSFSNDSDYCSHLKNLADQLANVGNPVSENKMVLQLVSGLTKGDYDTIATVIQQSDPLPSFTKARSQLMLEETHRSKQEAHVPHALVTERSLPSESSTVRDVASGRGNGRGCGRGNHRGRGRGRGRSNLSPHYSWSLLSWYSPNQWDLPPPCPYPTAQPNTQHGLLGPRPSYRPDAAVQYQSPNSITIARNSTI